VEVRAGLNGDAVVGEGRLLIERLRADEAKPRVEAGWGGQAAVGVLLALVVEEVAADVSGAIAGRLQPGGEDRGLVDQRAVTRFVVEDARVVGVLTAEVAGARWAAQRARDDAVLE
jgi:hypothetical protein